METDLAKNGSIQSLSFLFSIFRSVFPISVRQWVDIGSLCLPGYSQWFEGVDDANLG